MTIAEHSASADTRAKRPIGESEFPNTLPRPEGELDELERIWKETGRTIVLVTHNVREAVRLGQRVLLLSSRPGRVVQEWAVTEEHRTDAGLAGQLTGVITARLRE